MNNRNYWIQIGGKTQSQNNAAIWIFRWVESKDWDWAIGLEKDLGANYGGLGIYSSHTATNPAACPTSVNKFIYANNAGIFNNAPANSVFIRCV